MGWVLLWIGFVDGVLIWMLAFACIEAADWTVIRSERQVRFGADNWRIIGSGRGVWFGGRLIYSTPSSDSISLSLSSFQLWFDDWVSLSSSISGSKLSLWELFCTSLPSYPLEPFTPHHLPLDYWALCFTLTEFEAHFIALEICLVYFLCSL